MGFFLTSLLGLLEAMLTELLDSRVAGGEGRGRVGFGKEGEPPPTRSANSSSTAEQPGGHESEHLMWVLCT